MEGITKERAQVHAMRQLIGESVSFTGSDGQQHYAGIALRLEAGYHDHGGVRLVCTGRPGYDQLGDVCRLSIADAPRKMGR